MNLELADYQRSLQALEERLKTAQVELEQEKEEGHKQLEKTDSLRKEIGEHPLVFLPPLSRALSMMYRPTNPAVYWSRRQAL